VRKTERQLSAKLAPSRHSEGLIVATAASSKKTTQRAAIFSGRTSDASFKRVSANERLYQGASVRSQRRDVKVNESIASMDRQLAIGR
jgi:hypothetical protein